VKNEPMLTKPIRHYVTRRAWIVSRACRLVVGAVCGLSACGGVASRLSDEKAGQAMRELRNAEKTFQQQRGRFGELRELVEAGLVAQSLAGDTGSGRRFEIRVTGGSYEIVATPVKKDDTLGYVGWSFYCDESGVIRGRPYGRDNGYAAPGKDDPAIPSQ
jgi:hypothetical protein